MNTIIRLIAALLLLLLLTSCISTMQGLRYLEGNYQQTIEVLREQGYHVEWEVDYRGRVTLHIYPKMNER